MLQNKHCLAVLVGAVMFLSVHAVRAEDDKGAAGACPADCPTPGRAMRQRTVTVTECVPETYQEKRIVCQNETHDETYTAYRYEQIPIQCTRTVMVSKLVEDHRFETCTIPDIVPYAARCTVMETHTSTRTVTRMESRCEDHGHFETREAGCYGLGTRCGCRHYHHSGCSNAALSCDPCAPDCCSQTVQAWVPNRVMVQVPVTCQETVCETVPVEKVVQKYKLVPQEVNFEVTTLHLETVPVVESYTVMDSKQVPYQATRKVTVAVPHEEIVTLTRMVTRCVTKVICEEVPCGANAGCCSGRSHLSRCCR